MIGDYCDMVLRVFSKLSNYLECVAMLLFFSSKCELITELFQISRYLIF